MKSSKVVADINMKNESLKENETMLKTELGNMNVINNAEGKEGKVMLANTGAKSELEMRREKLIKEFLIQRKKAFKFENLGTVGNWEGKEKNEEQDTIIQEFRAKYKTWTYTCYDIKGRLYLMLISDRNCESFESITKVSEEFNLLSIEYFNDVYTLELDLCNVEYIVADKNNLHNLNHCYDYIDNIFCKIYADNLKLFLVIYVDNDEMKLYEEREHVFSFGEIFNKTVEIDAQNLQYYNLCLNIGNVFLLESFSQNNFSKYTLIEDNFSKNTLTEGDVGYKEYGLSDNTIIYENAYTGEKYTSDIDFFDEKMFLYKCEGFKIKAIKLDINNKSWKKSFKMDFDYEAIQVLISCENGEIYYSLTENTLKVYFDYKDDCYFVMYNLINRTKRTKDLNKQVEKNNKVSEEELKEIRQYMAEFYARSLVTGLTDDGFAVVNIDNLKCWYRYDENKDWMILYRLEADNDENYYYYYIKIPDCFDVVYVEEIFDMDTEYWDLGNIQYLMTKSNGNFGYGSYYIKAEKLKFTQMLDEQGNMKKLGLKSKKRQINLQLRSPLYFDLLYHRVIYEEGSIYLPSLEYYNEDVENFGVYSGIDRVKKGSLGYKEVQEHKRKIAARNRRKAKKSN